MNINTDMLWGNFLRLERGKGSLHDFSLSVNTQTMNPSLINVLWLYVSSYAQEWDAKDN